MKDWIDVDEDGNNYSCKEGCVLLRLSSEQNAWRRIGVYKDGDFVKGKTKKLTEYPHKHHLSESWSTSYIVVKNHMEKDKYVVWITDIGTFRAKAYDVISNASVKYFKKEGYEVQYYMPEKYMEKLNDKDGKWYPSVTEYIPPKFEPRVKNNTNDGNQLLIF